MSDNDLFGYAGKILRINLYDNRITTEPTLKYAKEWMGSSGIAIKILYDEVKSWVTPYDPANKIIFGIGALIGTSAPGANKICISTLGPVTGGWASSCCDSHLGGQLKFAGYDLVIVEGRARKPVYIWINDDQVEIRDATQIWGKTTGETLDILRKENNDPNLHTLSIGPAGENLNKGACVIQDKSRAAGRGGIGAVLGSKNLKAITAKGTGAIKISEPEKFMNLAAKIRKRMKKGHTFNGMQTYGTLSGLQMKMEKCQIQWKNFQECVLPDDLVEVLDPRKVVEKYQVSRKNYPGCAIGCSRNLFISHGPYAGLQAECNQWEVYATLQARLAIQDPTFMVKANSLCDQLGLDVDATGAAIGWAMECYQRKIIDKNDADGLELKWGDAGVALELMRKIAYRDGFFGNLLAEGCSRASDILGRNSSYYAIHVKGMALYETCRAALGWCLGAITSTRGGGHTTGAIVAEMWPDSEIEKGRKIFGVSNPTRPLEYDGKAKMVTFSEVLHRADNCCGTCHFNTVYWDPDFMKLQELAELYTFATGWKTTVDDLKRITKKQLNLEKALNLIHTNFDRKDDMPDERELNEPIPGGKLKGWKFDKEKLNKMLDEYYKLHGWDKETSFPTEKTLLDLGLENVIKDLKKIGKLR